LGLAIDIGFIEGEGVEPRPLSASSWSTGGVLQILERKRLPAASRLPTT